MNFFRQRKIDRLRKYLIQPTQNIGWREDYSWQQEENGRLALRELLRRLNEPKTRRTSPVLPITDHNYIYHLHVALTALEQRQFCLACNEVNDVLHFSVSRQVLFNVQALIEPYIGGT